MRKLERFAPLFVALVATLVYANSLANGFAVDDDYIIANNPRVHSLDDPAAIWLTPYWPGFGYELGLYRPLAIFVYALQWSAAGGAPWFFHLVSVLLHAGVSVLVFLLLARLTSRAAALAGAALFAVHPLHTEAVANVVGQAELIAVGAVIGACVLWAHRPVARVEPLRLLAIALLYALGLLAKESAVVLPGLLIALDLAQRRFQSRDVIGPERSSDTPTQAPRAWHAMARAWFPPLVALTIALVAFLALRMHVLGSITGVDAAPNLSFLRSETRVLNALQVWPEYARLLFFPVDLSADYAPAVIVPATSVDATVLLGAVLLMATIVLALTTPWRPGIGLTAAWFLISVLPVSNLLFPIGVLLAERTLYLPSVALSIAVAFAWATFAPRVSVARHRLALAGIAIVLSALAARSFVRNPDWDSSAAYYAALERDHPESYHAQWGIAAAALHRGDFTLARRHMEMAYRLWPNDPQQLNEYALLFIWSNEYSPAVPLLERSVELRPFAHRSWIDLAYVYLGTQRFTDALRAVHEAASLGAKPVEVAAIRAQAYDGREQNTEALKAWQSVVAQPEGQTYTFWAAYARALDRNGEPGAFAAADSAFAFAPDAERERMELLRASVARHCYTDPTSCDDPLADWAIITASRALPPAIDTADSAMAGGVR